VEGEDEKERKSSESKDKKRNGGLKKNQEDQKSGVYPHTCNRGYSGNGGEGGGKTCREGRHTVSNEEGRGSVELGSNVRVQK